MADLQIKKCGIYERGDGNIVAWTGETDHEISEMWPNATGCVGHAIYESDGKFVGGNSSLDLVREIVVGEGWKPWNGGTIPVEGRFRVDALTRSGSCFEECASQLDWKWNPLIARCDIVAYRVLPDVVEQPVEVLPALVEAPLAARRYPIRSLPDGRDAVLLTDHNERVTELLAANTAYMKRIQAGEDAKGADDLRERLKIAEGDVSRLKLANAVAEEALAGVKKTLAHWREGWGKFESRIATLTTERDQARAQRDEYKHQIRWLNSGRVKLQDETYAGIGQTVGRPGEYEFDGELRGVFTKINGSLRVAVECTAPGAKGTTHVFAPEQLVTRQVEPAKSVGASR